jgi:PAS domain S-box-containing protein
MNYYESVIKRDEIAKLYNSSPMGLHSLDINGFYLLINDTELEWLGYERHELIGKKRLIDFIIPAQKYKFTEKYPIFIKEGYVKEFEVDLIRKNGAILPISLNSTAIYDEEGNFVMSRTTVFDLRKRKELENQLTHKNKELNQLLLQLKAANESLYHLNQEKNRFLGIASHDLQTPLTNLRLLTDKFKLTQENLTERQKFWITDIQDTIEDMTGRIRNLLSVNRIEQGANMPTLEETNLCSFIVNMIGRFQNLADRKFQYIRFERDIDEVSIRTDPAYLVEIIENLLSNAIKFSPKYGEILVKIVVQKNQAIVSISDRGEGIKPEEMPLLFGRFQKLSTRPTGGETSSGLGLSIVKEHAQKIEASITCESEYGYGATFNLALKS